MRRLDSSPSARRRLVCFPHAGGAATYFAPLAKAMPGSIDVLALQSPGRQERLSERCIDSIEALTEAIVPELDGWLDGPFALFGHSMGAIVAFEVARALEQQQGLVPVDLFVSGRRAPSTSRDEHVHRGGDRALINEVTRLGGTPRQLLDDEEVRQMMLPALRGDYKAIETYVWQPGPPLTCSISALVGESDPLTTEAEAAAWRTHTTGAFDLRTFRGGHFYLAGHLPELVALLSDKLTGP
ncbi:MAG TPA: alpha/beta fold hydrolase [Acidimicrobiales bacterium]